MFAKRGGNIVTVGAWTACLPVIRDWAGVCVLKLLEVVTSIFATSFPWAPGWAVWILERQTTVFRVSHTHFYCLYLPLLLWKTVSLSGLLVWVGDDLKVGDLSVYSVVLLFLGEYKNFLSPGRV